MINRSRLSKTRRLILAAALGSIAGSAVAQQYPERPVKIVVPYAPSGGTDIFARMIAEHLEKALGKSVIIENKPGAAGNIGTETVAKAAPDGYTLLMAGTANAVNQTMFRKLPFDMVKDFTPVSIFATTPLVAVVHPSVPVNTIQELVALAKSKPGVLNYSSGGIGTANHLGGELLKSKAGIDMMHVAYKGGGAAMNDLLAGHVQLQIGTIPSLRKLVEAGKLRALATTGAKRSPVMPDLPTVAEAGVPGYEIVAWYGVFAPAGTPQPIVDRLSKEIAQISRLPDVQEKLKLQGSDAVGSTPQEAVRFFRTEIDRWAPIIKAGNMYAD